MFSDSFLNKLPKNPILATSQVVKSALSFYEDMPVGAEIEQIDYFIDALALVNALLSNTNISIENLESPNIEIEEDRIAIEVAMYLKQIDDELNQHVLSIKMAHYDDKYKTMYGNIFTYEFTDGDLNRIQKLINELRNIVSTSDVFEDDYKSRLLARLEKLQSELHKKMSDLDRFWGLMGEAGVAFGKFGENAKPFVDVVKKIKDIIWNTQKQAEQLSTDTPLELIDDNEGDLE